MKKATAILILMLTALSANAGKPVIGISPSYSDPKVYAKESYLMAVERAGGLPLILPMVSDARTADELVSLLDGLLMTGGEDVDPAWYGEDILNGTVSVNAPRDTTDMLLLEAARKRGIPVLGICRGEQIVNVFRGGSLWQDLPSQVGVEVAHRQKEPYNVGTHWAYIEKGTLLHSLLQTDSVMVNTFHHQAVKRLAEGFTVNARGADGVVEGYEGPGCLCVQFHPEGFVSKGDDTFLPIFEDFIKKARKAHRRR